MDPNTGRMLPGPKIEVTLSGSVLFGPPGSDVVLLPSHLMNALVDFDPHRSRKGAPSTLSFGAALHNPTRWASGWGPRADVQEQIHPLGVNCLEPGTYVTGPGIARLGGSGQVDLGWLTPIKRTRHLALTLEFPVAGWDRPVSIRQMFVATSPGADELAAWRE
jgi:hypothetical protein